jgi:tRNA threonylcarbamoyladenosine biosynthesis protein TsaE
MRERPSETEKETLEVGRELAREVTAGDILLFSGDLGAGKTTMIRGLLRELGHEGTVRSPTFNLIQTFELKVPVMHADLYRLKSAEGLGLEEYFASHLCLIEWPDRLGGVIDPAETWRIDIEFASEGRLIRIRPPEI